MASIILHHWAIYVYLVWIVTVSAIILCQRKTSGKQSVTPPLRAARPVRAAMPALRPRALTLGSPLTKPVARRTTGARKPTLPLSAGRESPRWEPFAYSI
jgi:hypothetical protein